MSYMGNDGMSDGVCFEIPIGKVAMIVSDAKIAAAKLRACVVVHLCQFGSCAGYLSRVSL